MAASWFWIWSWGDRPSTAKRRKAESMEQAACKEAKVVMTPEDTGWTFCVQRCGTKSVYEVEVKQTVHRTAKVLGLAEGVGR